MEAMEEAVKVIKYAKEKYGVNLLDEDEAVSEIVRLSHNLKVTVEELVDVTIHKFIK